MESNLQQVELLQAAVVLAAADGRITASERGLLSALAGRVGVGRASLDAMVDRALVDESVKSELFRRTQDCADQAMILLVAAARIDGEITDEERQVLVYIMEALHIPTEHFADLYQRGIAKADELRRSRPGK